MKTNFEIKHNHAIIHEGQYIDLHNNFDLAGLMYDATKRELILSWTKMVGDWVPTSDPETLTIIHEQISYWTIMEHDEPGNSDDEKCLGDITFFPSSDRAINDSIIPRAKPEAGDDILYSFESGRTIRINCQQITVTV